MKKRLAMYEMGALRSLVSNFPPTLSRFHLFDSWAWSDEFTEFVFVEMKGLKNVRLVECTHSMVIYFLVLLNKVNDWEGCCILPLLANILIQFDYWDNEESKLRTQDEIALYTTVSEKLHEACVSLKKDGYAFKIDRSLEDPPITE